MPFAPTHPAPFTETGEVVYSRTYSRTKQDGSKETWAETVERVVVGNLKLVYGSPTGWDDPVWYEYNLLCDYLYDFKIVPGGRHLWATGVGKRQYLANCHLAGWGEKMSEHFEFAFMRLMEGGGVGANYSTKYISRYGAPKHKLKLHIVCDAEHKDYADLAHAGVLSTEFVSDWSGCYQIPDTREGWAEALVDLIDTYYRDDTKHQDRVYDVSIIRPSGAKLHTFGGTASGPAPLAKMLHEVAAVLNAAHEAGQVTPLDAMEIDHSIGQCVVAGGVRRSARMSIVRWDDPAIFDFLACKSDPAKHWTTNISVEIDGEFLRALADEDPRSWNALKARRIHTAVVTGMLNNGEPGYWNSELSNVGEVDWVQGTNPCGEIPLNEWDVCNLGHVNLEAFVGKPDELPVAHVLVTRFLIRATFGDFTDPKQAAVVQRNRRIGVGHFGVQGFLVKNGIKYSEAIDSDFPHMLEGLSNIVRQAADDYAFELRIVSPIKVTTVAPTGSIAKMPGATEGIHPVLYRWFIRRIRFSSINPGDVAIVQDYFNKGYKVEACKYAPNTVVVEIPTKEKLVAEVEALGYPASMVETANEIGLDKMLEFQQMYQTFWADNAVSFTVNFPEGRYTVAEASAILERYLSYLKGTTLMPDGTREQAPYEALTEEQYEILAGRTAVTVAESYDEQCASGACPIR